MAKVLSKRDIVATDPGAPFGGGVQSMGGGGSSSGSGTAAEASPNHQGPPPAAAGASHIIRCNECGYVASDGGDLDEHMRKEHFVRETLSSRNDVTVPAALIFIDAMGDTIPFKSSFTFKELSDFCLREGVTFLAGDTFSEAELIKIAQHVATITNNHVQIETKTTKTAGREPLSSIDLSVAVESAERECRKCRAKIASYRVFCDPCSQRLGESRSQKEKKVIAMYANVTLKDGANLHVVEITGDDFIGVDDFFEARAFKFADAAVIHNLDDDLRSVEASRCDRCGEEVFQFSSKCANCGYTRTASFKLFMD